MTTKTRTTRGGTATTPVAKSGRRPARRPPRTRALVAGATAALVAVGLAVLATRSGPSSDQSGKAGLAATPASSAPVGPAGSAKVGGQAPAFSMATLSGSIFTFPAGKPTAIFFTASYCGSCLPKAQAFARIRQEVGDRVAILGVDVDPSDSESAFREWIAAAGNPAFDFAIDRDSRLVQAYDVRALSTVVIADADGRVVYRSFEESGEETLRAALTRAGLT